MRAATGSRNEGLFSLPADAIGTDQRPDEIKEAAAKPPRPHEIQSLRVGLLGIILGQASAFRVHEAEIRLTFGISLTGCKAVPSDGFGISVRHNGLAQT
jgi:hypothetical protein